MIYFVLGSHPTLSAAEITKVYKEPLQTKFASEEVLILKNQTRDPRELQNALGGTTQIGETIGGFDTYSKEELAEFLASYIQTQAETEKIQYGLSVYDAGNQKLADDMREHLDALGMEIKNNLREAGKSVRYVSSKKTALSSVIIKTNNLLHAGGAYALIATPDGIQIGQARTVQAFKRWSDRDYGRPARDPESGMLPPKLASMMVNLTGGDPQTDTLLDPFCGSGTVLMEALLRKYKKLIGNDLEETAIADSLENLTWLQEEYAPEMSFEISQNMSDTDATVRLTQGKAEVLNEVLPHESVDRVATEPYLGPPQSGGETQEDIENITEELKVLYSESMKALYKVMKPGATAAVSFPAFVRNDSIVFLPLKNILESAGFTVDYPVSEDLPGPLKRKTPSGGMLYERKGQNVAREIIVFKK
jgi:tRNA G10  N-methylase Trm11